MNDRAKELEKQARAALREDRERADHFRSLVRQTGWAIYVELLGKMIQGRGDELIGPITPDQALSQEFNKGAIYGLLLAQGLPSTIIAAMASESSDDDDGSEGN